MPPLEEERPAHLAACIRIDDIDGGERAATGTAATAPSPPT